MPTHATWDREAAQWVERVGLDKEYEKQRAYFDGLASEAWERLRGISQSPKHLKASNLYKALIVYTSECGKTQTLMEKLGVGEPTDRGQFKFYSWFTWYIVERFLESTRGGQP